MRWARVEVFVPERIEVDIRLPKEKKTATYLGGYKAVSLVILGGFPRIR
jgi:hypothetical protein